MDLGRARHLPGYKPLNQTPIPTEFDRMCKKGWDFLALCERYRCELVLVDEEKRRRYQKWLERAYELARTFDSDPSTKNRDALASHKGQEPSMCILADD